MEYADGGDLNDRIKQARQRRTPFSEDEVLGYFVQICLGVKHIHDQHIVHRDLKSQVWSCFACNVIWYKSLFPFSDEYSSPT